MNNDQKPKTPIESFWDKNARWLIGGGLVCLAIVFLPQILNWASNSILAYKDVKQAWEKI